MRRSSLFLIVAIMLWVSCTRAQWLPASIGLPTNWGNATSIDASDSLIIGLASSLGIYRSTDGGITWKVIGANPLTSVGGSPMDISIINTSHVWVACSNGAILATNDGGAHWTTQFLDSTKSIFMDYIEFFDLNSGIAIGDGFANVVAVLRTSDGGSHWISDNTQPLDGWSGDIWRRMDFVNMNVGYFYVSGPQTLNKTTDGGVTWIPTPTQPPYVQVLKFFNQNIGFVIADTGRIFRTLDGAVSWQAFPTPHKGWGNDIEFAPSNPARIWITDNLKVYFSSDTGRTWTTQLAVGGRDLVFPTPYNGWFVGDGGKLYHTTNGGTTAVEDVASHPSEFVLHQNYPNPFNPSTSITFTLPEKVFVLLKVFDLLGQEITTLVAEEMQSGTHTKQWNATTTASGIYFCRLQAGSFIETKKLILMR